MQEGKIDPRQGLRHATLAASDAVTPRTMFAIGSVTKQFTCSALMILAEEKKLSLTDPVVEVLSRRSRARRTSHSSTSADISPGYRDYYPLDFVDNEMQKPATADAIITSTRRARSTSSRARAGRTATRLPHPRPRDREGRAVSRSAHSSPSDCSRRSSSRARRTSRRGARHRHGQGLHVVRTRAADSGGRSGSERAGPAPPARSGRRRPTSSTWDRALVEHKLISAESYATMTTARRLTDGRSQRLRLRRRRERPRSRDHAVARRCGERLRRAEHRDSRRRNRRSCCSSNTDFAAIGALNQELVASAHAAGRRAGRFTVRQRSRQRRHFSRRWRRERSIARRSRRTSTTISRRRR